MKILGLSGTVYHDASAALVVDGKLVAAAEEERFLRDKHAKGRFPVEAAKFCLRHAGLDPREVDAVAMPYAAIPLTRPARWHYACFWCRILYWALGNYRYGGSNGHCGR